MTVKPVTVVAISRQKGCGGVQIGQAVAQRRGLGFIDGAILREASDYLMTHDPKLEQVGERVNTWWSTMAEAIAMGGLSGLGMLPIDSVRDAEAAQVERRIIEELGQSHAAVIVGRGAGHVLRGRPGVVTVFLHAPEESRIERIAERDGLDEQKARGVVRESDRERAEFMRALTGVDWTDVRQYDLSIDTAATGLELATSLILQLVPPRSAT
jgi:cytidylate kinase